MRATISCCCCEALDGRIDRRRLLRSLGIAGLAASLPISARAAEGEYDAMLLSCIDPRMVAPVYKYMEGQGLSRQIQPALHRRRRHRRRRSQIQGLAAGVLGQHRDIAATAPHQQDHRDRPPRLRCGKSCVWQ